MEFDSFLEVKRGGGHGSSCDENAIMSSLRIGKEGKQRGKNIICIHIGSDIAKRLRWMNGDYVTVGFNRELRTMGIMRVNPQKMPSKQSYYIIRGASTMYFRFSIGCVSDDLQPIITSFIGNDGVTVDDFEFIENGVAFILIRGDQ